MARSDATVILSRAFVLGCAVVTIAALYFAKEVLLPLALAILLTFMLSPLVKRLEKWGSRRIPAVLAVVAVASMGLGALGYVLVVQMYDIAYRLPEFKDNIVAKVESLQGDSGGLIDRVSDALADVQKKISRKNSPEPQFEPSATTSPDVPIQDATSNPLVDPTNATGDVLQPTPVEIVDELSAKQVAENVLGPIIRPLGTAALVLVFVVFILIERENLRNRVIHLMGSRQLNVATQALDDAAYRVSRYLLMQLIVNAAFGIVIAIGLFFIGLPNALVWGVLATVLRFVPYIGPWIAATIPIILAAALFEGWTRPLLVFGLFVVNELISNNVIEPWLYGSRTGISTMGILVSAVFWTWLWGPIGLVMSTPLTVCLTVIGRYVPQLSFLNTLLSDEEALPPEERFYQRLLALDPEEASDIAEEYLKANSLEALYDNVLLPALSLAEQDRHHGDLDDSKVRFILDAMRELVGELGAKAKAAREKAQAAENSEVLPVPPLADRVLCLPARDEADEIAGMMLSQLLEAKGVDVVLVSAQSMTGEMVLQVSEEQLGIVCVSALPPLAVTHARYLCKRLRPKFPTLKIVVGLWQTSGSSKKAEARLMETGIDQFVTTLAEAMQQLVRLVASQRMLRPTTILSDTPAHC